MPIPPDTDLRPHDTRHALFILLCALSGLSLVLTMLTLLYTWISGYCQYQNATAEFASIGVACALTAAAALACSRELARTGKTPARSSERERARFVAGTGIALNGFSLLILIGFAVPILLLRPCD